MKMIVYGMSGTGKTTFVGSFPGRTRWYICSGGKESGELRSIDTPDHRARVEPFHVEGTDQLLEDMRAGGGYDNYVLDHATGLSDLFLKEIMGLDEIPIAKFRQAGKGESWSLVSKQQYGQLSIKLKEVFREMLNLRGNVILIGQERKFGGDEEGGADDTIKPTLGPALTPSVMNWLGPACDFVVQTFKRPRYVHTTQDVGGKQLPITRRDRGVEYCLRTEPHDLYMTKFRLAVGLRLPDCIVLGNSVDGAAGDGYEKFMAIIRGEYQPNE